MIFQQTRTVEFQHCDPAGIVFYPRYFEMISSVVERFFTDALGNGFAGQLTLCTTVPLAGIEVDFHAPSRLGNTLVFALTITHIGSRSTVFRITCTGTEPRFTAIGTLVHFDLNHGRSAPWPDDLRAGLASYLMEPA